LESILWFFHLKIIEDNWVNLIHFYWMNGYKGRTVLCIYKCLFVEGNQHQIKRKQKIYWQLAINQRIFPYEIISYWTDCEFWSLSLFPFWYAWVVGHMLPWRESWYVTLWSAWLWRDRIIIWADMILIGWLDSMNHIMTKVIASNRDLYVILNIWVGLAILTRPANPTRMYRIWV
jgi:hypothetical protein